MRPPRHHGVRKRDSSSTPILSSEFRAAQQDSAKGPVVRGCKGVKGDSAAADEQPKEVLRGQLPECKLSRREPVTIRSGRAKLQVTPAERRRSIGNIKGTV